MTSRKFIKKPYTKFRSILKEAIEGVSVKDAADKLRVSEDSLNSMIHSDFIEQPSKYFLKTVSDTFGVPIETLLDACGYTDELVLLGKKKPETEHECRIILPIEERRVRNVYDLMYGFNKIKSRVAEYDRIGELFAFFNMIYACEHLTFHIIKEHEDEAGKTSDLIRADFDAGIFTVSTYFLLDFLYTENDCMLLKSVTFNGASLLHTGDLPKRFVDSFPYVSDVASLPYISIIERSSGAYMAEQRLLDSIFDRTASIKAPTTVFGYGFYLDPIALRAANIEAFLVRHLNSISADYREEVLFNIEHNCMDEFFDAHDEVEGYEYLIAEVMSAESGLPFCSFSAYDEEEDWKIINRTCIMVQADGLGYDEEKDNAVKRAAYTYAKELGLPRIEECVYQYTATVNDPEEGYDVIEIER